MPSAYRFLAKIMLSQQANRPKVVTTNIDEKIEEAFREAYVPNKGVIVTVAGDEDYRALRVTEANTSIHTFLYKLHGTLSRPHTILSTAHDSLSPGKGEALEQILHWADLVVFIGYSARDEDIVQGFSTCTQNWDPTDPGKTCRVFWASRTAQSGKQPGKDKLRALFAIPRRDGQPVFEWTEYQNVHSHMFFRELFRELSSEESRSRLFAFPSLLETDKPFCLKKSHGWCSDYPDAVGDPIYGVVELPDYLWDVIDSGAIQRLRNIKQLSMAYYVFPDATHSRFSHSLGVAHLMHKVAGLLGFPPETASSCVLAALLHDIGHGPFGHAVEVFMNRLPEVEKGHEDFTREFVDKGLLDLDAAFAKITLNRNKVLELLGRKTALPTLSAEKMLVGNGGFDLDRLDFLLRDLYHAGVVVESRCLERLYSLQDRKALVNTLLESIRIADWDRLPDEDKGEFSKGSQVVCFHDTPRVRECLNAFFNLYVFMYDRVYYKGINRGAQAMIAKAMSLAHEIGDLELWDLHAFTDAELFSLLEASDDNRIRELALCVKYRFLFDAEIISEVEIPQIAMSMTNQIEERLRESVHMNERNVDDMVMIDVAPAKNICDFVYLRKEDTNAGVLEKFRFRPQEWLRDEYERLARPRMHLVFPQSRRGDLPVLRERLVKILRSM